MNHHKADPTHSSCTCRHRTSRDERGSIRERQANYLTYTAPANHRPSLTHSTSTHRHTLPLLPPRHKGLFASPLSTSLSLQRRGNLDDPHKSHKPELQLTPVPGGPSIRPSQQSTTTFHHFYRLPLHTDRASLLFSYRKLHSVCRPNSEWLQVPQRLSELVSSLRPSACLRCDTAHRLPQCSHCPLWSLGQHLRG